MRSTIIWQRIEGGLVFAAALGLALFLGMEMPWWGALLVFFAPDLTFLAYLAGPRVGALAYNLAHLYPMGFFIMGFTMFIGGASAIAVSVGLLLIAHAGFDRALGYGLKSPEGFGQTHLGPIGKHAKEA
ncbi:DUF4260 family protein [Celeribacter sp.]|uniref:DUF4260 family protein n=1 Tax=Celeribacter sp. TaxID=1890673 RepID=UPI003A93F967